MKWWIWLLLMIFIMVYALINFYIGLRGWQNIFQYIPHLCPAVYWIIFYLIVFAIFLEKLCQRFIPKELSLLLSWVGSYWLGMMFYSLIIIGVLDLLRLMTLRLHLLNMNNSFFSARTAVWGAILTLVFIQVYGTWNAWHPQVRRYEITLPQKAGYLRELHMVMVSDIHMDRIVGKKRLEKMTEMINKADPDLVVFTGDIIDGSIEVFSRDKVEPVFQSIKPKYGVYAVPGNHDYISGKMDEFVRNMENAGVKVLRDEKVKIAESFYLLGRDDRSMKRFTGTARKELTEIMNGIEKDIPLIILDHEPSNLQEAESAGADLQLSGHTHRGQLWPNHLITGLIYENDWGYYKRGSLQVIVSSGYGTWGPPIRLGNKPEVVEIFITFAPAQY